MLALMRAFPDPRDPALHALIAEAEAEEDKRVACRTRVLRETSILWLAAQSTVREGDFEGAVVGRPAGRIAWQMAKCGACALCADMAG